MTLTDAGCVHWPRGLTLTAGQSTLSDTIAHTINDANDIWSAIFQAAITDDIVGASFSVRVVAGAENLAVEIWGVSNTTGKPDSVKASVTVDQEVSAGNTSYEVTFGTPYAATKNEMLALVIRPASDWVSGDIDILAFSGLLYHGGLPYEANSANAGTDWTLDEGLPYGVGIEYDGARWYCHENFYPAQDTGGLSIDGTPAEAGIKFEPAVDCTLRGISLQGDFDVDFTVELYSGSTTPTNGDELLSYDSSYRPTTGGEPFTLIFDTPQPLVKDTVYRVTILRASGTINIAYLPVAAHEMKETFGIPYAKRTSTLMCQENGASWDDTTGALRLPLIQLLLDQFHDDDAGGGGGTDSILGGGSLTGGFA